MVMTNQPPYQQNQPPQFQQVPPSYPGAPGAYGAGPAAMPVNRSKAIRLALGTVIVAGVVIAAGYLISILGGLSYGGGGQLGFYLLRLLPIAFFVGGAFLSLVFIVPLSKGEAVKDALVAVLVAGGIGTVAMVIVTAIITSMQASDDSFYQQFWFSSAILTPLSTGILYSGLVGFGGFLALALEKDRERRYASNSGPAVPQAQSTAPGYYVPQQQPVQPQEPAPQQWAPQPPQPQPPHQPPAQQQWGQPPVG